MGKQDEILEEAVARSINDLLERSIPTAEETLVALKDATNGPLEAYAVLEIARRKLKAMICESGWEAAVADIEAVIDERIHFLMLPKGQALSPGGQS